jgi:hypothetical protein
MHHTNASLDGSARVTTPQFPASALDNALISQIMAEDDIHQGGFTRPIFTQNGEDFTGIYGKADISIGDKRAKTLSDVRNFQKGCH